MSFSGKATYRAGTMLPEGAEDLADIVAIVSPYETPLLNALGDSLREARDAHHGWLEDRLLPNKDVITETVWADPSADRVSHVEHRDYFREGDQIQVEGSDELMLVHNVLSASLGVDRGYAGTTREPLANGQVVNILGNSAIEGSDKPRGRFTDRVRCGNRTQVFQATVKVDEANITEAQTVADELDFQKQERLRGLLRELENAVLNSTNPMEGISSWLTGAGRAYVEVEGAELDETRVTGVLRDIWENSSGNVDMIVVGGLQKRKLAAFCEDNIYESDFGICRIVTTRWMPPDAALFLDSTRISVLPLAGRSFHCLGDEVVGEYTVEMKNPAGHGLVRALGTELCP